MSILLALILFLQQPPRGGGSGSHSPVLNKDLPSSNLPVSRPWDLPQSRPGLPVLTGRLLMGGLKVLPEPVPVEIHCPGPVEPVMMWSDLHGRFALPVTLQSLSAGGAPCELVVRPPGYSGVRRPLPVPASSKDEDLGPIRLDPAPHISGAVFSPASAALPESLRKEYGRAHEALLGGRTADARERLEKLVAKAPGYAAAHHLLAQLLMGEAGDHPGARAALLRAAESDPRYVKPLLQLAELAASSGDAEATLAFARKVLELAPGYYPECAFMAAAAHFNRRQFDLAERTAREALADFGPRTAPMLQRILAETLLQGDDHRGAIAAFRTFLEFAPWAPDRAAIEERLKFLESLSKSNRP